MFLFKYIKKCYLYFKKKVKSCFCWSFRLPLNLSNRLDHIEATLIWFNLKSKVYNDLNYIMIWVGRLQSWHAGLSLVILSKIFPQPKIVFTFKFFLVRVWSSSQILWLMIYFWKIVHELGQCDSKLVRVFFLPSF